MGVPAFFRWLTRKYPSVIVDAVEEKPRDLNGARIPVNTVDPNPNFQVIQQNVYRIIWCTGVRIFLDASLFNSKIYL